MNMNRCRTLVLLLAASAMAAGEAAQPAAPAAPAKPGQPAAKPGQPAVKPQPAKRLSALELVAEEEKWVFRPTVGRSDVFVDMEALLTAQKKQKMQIAEQERKQATGAKPGGQPEGSDVDKLVAWARGEESRIRQSVAARRFEEAMRIADAALKPLEAQIANPSVAPVIVSIRTYRAQAEEAKVRDDAQAAFDALKIRVLGVLWSQDGLRLAIIDGENRAVSVNDRVRDCPVINIDQDRVDFRFVFNRRRFEFPVFVEQSGSATRTRR
jgi:hypothetical protein